MPRADYTDDAETAAECFAGFLARKLISPTTKEIIRDVSAYSASSALKPYATRDFPGQLTYRGARPSPLPLLPPLYSIVKLALVCVALAVAIIGLLFVTDVISLDQLGGIAVRALGAIGIIFLLAIVLRSVLAGREVRDESDQRVP
jgi:hypothetical protein